MEGIIIFAIITVTSGVLCVITQCAVNIRAIYYDSREGENNHLINV